MDSFVAQAKAAAGPMALTGILDRALKAKDVFAFGELLDLPAVQALQASAHSGHYELLELFAYGTVGDYTAGHAAGRLPEVSPPVLQKLRMLTVASLASQQRTLPYSGLYPALGLVDGDSRGLEEVVISAVQAGLVAGRIDQRAAVFEVASVQGRDVRPSPESIDALLTRLRTWRAAVDDAAADAAAQLQRLHEASLSSASHAAALSTRLEEGRRVADKAADKEIEALGAAGGRRGGGVGYRVGGGSGPMGGLGTAYGGGVVELDDDDDEGGYGGDGSGGFMDLDEERLLMAGGGAGSGIGMARGFSGAGRRKGAAPARAAEGRAARR